MFHVKIAAMPKFSSSLYWKRNLQLVAALLGVWFLVSYGFGILFAPFLNRFHLGGFPLGFWFAQQGAILVFLVLLFLYAKQMEKLDQKFTATKNKKGSART